MEKQNQNNVTPEDVYTFNMLIFSIIIRHNDRLRLDAVEAIRRVLQNSDAPHISPGVQLLLRLLRDGLLEPPDPELVARMAKPPVRLVDNSEKNT